MYPRTNGYASFSVYAQGASAVTSGSSGYTNPSTKEYIKIQGGPHTASVGVANYSLHSVFTASTIYDVEKRRGSSLEVTMLSGSTIEFWMKKRASQLISKEVIFDFWNGESTSASTYGRITLYTSASNDSLYLTVRSGSTGFNDKLILNSAWDGNWNHYALTLKLLQGATSVNFYKNSVHHLSSSVGAQAATAKIDALSKTAGEANTRRLLVTDIAGNSINFLIDNSIATSTATNIAFGNANSDASQFATNIVSSVNLAQTAGSLNVTASKPRSGGSTVVLTQTTAGTGGNSVANISGTGVSDSVVTVEHHFSGGLDAGLSDIIGQTKANQATIGAMITSEAVGGYGGLGHAKLSASIDEFRFWKKERTHEEIDNTWFIPVGGGTNKHDSNVDLGVYYKFNEGITTNTTLDAKVLDYSGRIADGNWIGYTAKGEYGSRFTGSAIVESGVSLAEFQDPIIYSSHPDVSSSMARYKKSGSLSDAMSSTSFYKLFPGWMQEEDTSHGQQLKILSQIMGSYFDNVWHQMNAVNNLQDNVYVSGSNKPYPFARDVLFSKGFVFPNLFTSYSETERLLSKANTPGKFKMDIQDVKNTLYHNLNNSLISIYKSKGTEKSFRNFFRSMGIGSELVKLNMYADDATYVLKDNYYNDSVEMNYVDFYQVGNTDGTVYSETSSLNSNNYLKSAENYSSITMECNFILPNKNKIGSENFAETSFLTSSIFGFHTAEHRPDWSDTQATDYEVNVFLIKEKADLNLDEHEFPRIKFAVSSSVIGFLTSSYIANQYSGNNWNIALKIKHDKYPYSKLVTGSSTTNYTAELYGAESLGNTKLNSFSVSSREFMLAPTEPVFRALFCYLLI